MIYNRMIYDLDSNILLLFGLFLNILGAILLGIDTLGAKDFLSSLNIANKKIFAQTKFKATLNGTFSFFVFTIITLIVLLITLPENTNVFCLTIAPISYPISKLIIFLVGEVYVFTKINLHPKNQKTIIVILQWFIYFPWFVLIWVVYVLFDILLKLLLYLISEKFVEPLVLKCYYYAEKIADEEKKWKFKSISFYGILLLLSGFIYQFIGIVMDIIK